MQQELPPSLRAFWSLLILVSMMAGLVLLSTFQEEQEDSSKILPQSENSTLEGNEDRLKAPQLQSIALDSAVSDSLLAAGLPDRVAKNIIAYQKAGGKIDSRDRLMNIYGMNDSLLAIFLPFVDTSNWGQKKQAQFENWDLNSYTYEERAPYKGSKKQWTKRKSFKDFEINAAYAEDLMQIKGIGPVLSMRILDIREKLGGFRSKEELYGIWSLDSSVVDSLFAKAAFMPSKNQRKIDLNSASEEELRDHPYITWRLASVMVAYREQHGPYPDLATLNEIKIMRPETFSKISPYLYINDQISPIDQQDTTTSLSP